jgi:hypothetical protein
MKALKMLCICFMITPILLHAQQQAKEEKFSWGAYLSPEYNLRTNKLSPQIKKENYSYSFSTGLNIKHQLNKNIAFISGLGLGVKRYHDIALAVMFVKEAKTANNGTGNEYYYRNHEIISSNATYYEMQIPLLIQVNLWKNRFFTTSGIDFNQSLVSRVKSTVLFTDNNELINSSTNVYNKGNALALVIGFGLNTKAFNSTNLSIEPIVKFYPGIGSYNKGYGLATFGVKSTFYFAH